MIEKGCPKTSKAWELQILPTIGSHVVTLKLQLRRGALRNDLPCGDSNNDQASHGPKLPVTLPPIGHCPSKEIW